MTGAIRPLPSQLLATLAPKTASGGKNRACRLAPPRTSRNPLQGLGKSRLRGQARVGHRILGQTIGNAIAYQISQRSNSADQGQQAPGAGQAAQSDYLNGKLDSGNQAYQYNADGTKTALYTDANGNPTTTNTGTPYLIDETVPGSVIAPMDNSSTGAYSNAFNLGGGSLNDGVYYVPGNSFRNLMNNGVYDPSQPLSFTDVSSRTYTPAQQAANLALAQADLSDPRVQAFLTVLADKESGGRYNIITGGSTFSDYSQHPDIYVPSQNSTAAGAFQFTYPTWSDYSARLGLTNFSPQSQNLVAAYLLDDLGVVDALKSGNLTEAIFDAGQRWDAFPQDASGASLSGRGVRPLQPIINSYYTALKAKNHL